MIFVCCADVGYLLCLSKLTDVEPNMDKITRLVKSFFPSAEFLPHDLNYDTPNEDVCFMIPKSKSYAPLLTSLEEKQTEYGFGSIQIERPHFSVIIHKLYLDLGIHHKGFKDVNTAVTIDDDQEGKL